MAAFLYSFDWDMVKARSNLQKHGVGFEQAAGVFMDPLAATIPDEEHSGTEARWITLGKDSHGHYIVVVHTFEWLTVDEATIRVISARKPTRAEIRDYEAQE